MMAAAFLTSLELIKNVQLLVLLSGKSFVKCTYRDAIEHKTLEVI